MPTTLIYVLILLLCYYEVNGEKKACNKLPNTGTTAEPSALSALRKKLKCKHDVDSPPTNATNTRVDIQIATARHRMEYYGTNEDLLSQSFLVVEWQDDRLKYKASEYKNHTMVHMYVGDIWTPTPVVQGLGYFREPRYVIVLPSGHAYYLLWWFITAHCTPIYAKWADRRTCTISFRLEPADKLRLTAAYLLRSTSTEIQASWSIIEVKEEIDKHMATGNFTDTVPASSSIDNHGIVSLELIIQRNTAVIDASLFSPAAVLFLLLLASTWIPCEAAIRLAVLALTTLLAIFLMHSATCAVPTLPGRFSDFTVLYRDMVLVSGAAFLEWYVSYFMACKKISPSGRLEAFAGTASQSSYAFIRSILLIPTIHPKVYNGTPEGAFLSIVLDRITFITLLFVFIIIMISNSHRPISIPV